MEYLVVLFPRRRRLKIGTTLSQLELRGHTNEVVRLQGGPYTVTLAPPPNFKPKSKKIDLRNTSPLNPLTIVFRDA